MKELLLSQGEVAWVDDIDYARAVEYKWHALVVRRKDGSRRVYAVRHVTLHGGKRSTQYLHRFLIGPASDIQVDHIDGDGRNNCRDNLRTCNHSENQHNQRPRTHGSSLFKGVSWDSRKHCWVSQIKVGDKSRFLGYFGSEAGAAQAYDDAAVRSFGKYARPNFGGEK